MGCVANSTGTEVLLQLEALRSAAQLSQLFRLTEKRKVRSKQCREAAAAVVCNQIIVNNNNNNILIIIIITIPEFSLILGLCSLPHLKSNKLEVSFIGLSVCLCG